MKNDIDYQNRLPEHEEPRIIAEHDSAYVAGETGAETAATRRAIRRHRHHSNWLLWGALAFLAVVALIGSVYWYSGYGRHIGNNVDMYGSNDVGNVILTEEYAAYIPATGSPTTQATTRSQTAATDASDSDSQASAQSDGSASGTADVINDIVYIFPLNSTAITNNSTLDRLAKQVAASGDIVTIIAYTDKSGDKAYNQRLSEKRARSIGDYLISHGVKAGKIKAIGKGESDTYANPALDRRAEIHVTHS